MPILKPEVGVIFRYYYLWDYQYEVRKIPENLVEADKKEHIPAEVLQGFLDAIASFKQAIQ